MRRALVEIMAVAPAALALSLISGCDDHNDRARVATAFRDPHSVRYRSFKTSSTSACGEVSADGDPQYRRFLVYPFFTGEGKIMFEPANPIRRAQDFKAILDIDRHICADGEAAFLKGAAPFPRLECSMGPADTARYAATAGFTKYWAKCMMDAPEH